MKSAILCAVLGAVLVSGCTKEQSKPITDPLCDTAIKALTGAAQGVGAALGCTNVPAIAAAFAKPVKDLDVCKEGQAGLIGDIVCPQASKFVLDMGLAALPADWQCTGGGLGDNAKAVIEEQCKKAVTF